MEIYTEIHGHGGYSDPSNHQECNVGADVGSVLVYFSSTAVYS
jgi:hypothetical protein